MESTLVDLSKYEIDNVGGGLELSEVIGGFIGAVVTMGGLYLLNRYLDGRKERVI